jgi:hypothetical protein
MEIDEGGPSRAVPHTLYQFAKVCPGISDQDVARVAQVMQMSVGEPGLLRGGQPYALPEVGVMQRLTCRTGEDQVSWGRTG